MLCPSTTGLLLRASAGAPRECRSQTPPGRWDCRTVPLPAIHRVHHPHPQIPLRWFHAHDRTNLSHRGHTPTSQYSTAKGVAHGELQGREHHFSLPPFFKVISHNVIIVFFPPSSLHVCFYSSDWNIYLIF